MISNTTKEAVLLINLGTPNDPGVTSVRKYLSQFLGDGRVIDIPAAARFMLVNGVIIPFRSFRSSKLYKKIWTPQGSPLKTHSFALRDALQKSLGQKYVVELAMRYQQPSIENALTELRKYSPSAIHVIPLYPQYASSSTGSSLEAVMKVLMKWEVIPELKIHGPFFNHPAFLEAQLSVAKKYDISKYDHIIFSYHGLPERQILKPTAEYGGHRCNFDECCDVIHDGNRYCYRAACMETTRQLVRSLQIPEGKYTTSFQSRLDDKWLKPYSDKVVESLAKSGKKRILVFSPAFVADCLETIYEISEEYGEIFREHGGDKVELVESLNARPEWVAALQRMIAEKN